MEVYIYDTLAEKFLNDNDSQKREGQLKRVFVLKIGHEATNLAQSRGMPRKFPIMHSATPFSAKFAFCKAFYLNFSQ